MAMLLERRNGPCRLRDIDDDDDDDAVINCFADGD